MAPWQVLSQEYRVSPQNKPRSKCDQHLEQLAQYREKRDPVDSPGHALLGSQSLEVKHTLPFSVSPL